MIMDVNKVTLVWMPSWHNYIKTKESDDKSILKFVISTNRKYQNASGAIVHEKEEHKCIAYSTNAEIINKYINNQKYIYVEWRLKTSKRESADGSQKYSTEIVVENFIFLDEWVYSKSEKKSEDHMW